MRFGESHTNLIQLDGIELCAARAQQLLRLAAVRAVALAEDGDGVLVDDGLDLCFCGGHGGGAVGPREEAREEGYGGGWLGGCWWEAGGGGEFELSWAG